MEQADEDCKFFEAAGRLIPPLHNSDVDDSESDEEEENEYSVLNKESNSEPVELLSKLQHKIELLQEMRNAGEKKKGTRVKDQKEKNRKKVYLKGNKSKPQETPAVTNATAKKTSPPPVYNKAGKLVFSRFDFAEKKKKEKKPVPKDKKYKKLMDKLQKKKEKMETVVQTEGEEAAKQLETKEAWKDALKKAEGVKVIEGENFIKTKIKKMEKQREKSKKKWAERKSQVENRKEKKQEKRKANIKAKKDQRKDKKIKKLRKKGKLLPGF